MSKRATRAIFSNSIAGLEPGGQDRGNRSRSALLVGTALGASILIFSLAPNSAWAANDCGPVITAGSSDIAICSPAGNVYPNGISYIDSGGNALQIIVEPGVVVTDINTALDVYAHNTAGDAVIVAYSGDLISGGSKGLYALTTVEANLALVESGATVTAAYGVGAVATAPGGAAEALNAGPVYASAEAVFAKALDGYGRVSNSGTLSVTNSNGFAGYGIYVGAETGIVSNTGNISVSGNFNLAAGVRTEGTNGYIANSGVVTVDNTEGLAFGLSVGSTGGGPAVVRNTGDLSVTGYSHAKGIYAYGVTASVSSTGNISTTSIDGTAIAAQVTSFGGYNNVVLDGTIYAHAEGNGYAYGALVTGSGPGVFELTGGSIYAKADGGSAVGVGEYMKGSSAYVNTRGGPVRAYGLISATGVSATGDNVRVYTGAVYASAGETNATGVNAAAATGDVTIRGYGDITAVGAFGATGVTASAANGYATVLIDGNITANGGLQAATGVSVTDDTGGYVRVDGNVSATAERGATGIKLQSANGDATVYVAGNVYAHDVYGGVGVGVDVVAGAGNAVVDVTGNVHVRAQSRTRAYGVEAFGYNDTVVVGGNVNMVGYYSTIGVEALAPGNSTVIVGGTVSAFAYDGEAIGVTASSGAGHTTHVSVGGVGATGYVAYGITTGDNGASIIYVGSGGVNVFAEGKAVGIAGTSGESSSSVTVVGATSVTSLSGSAYGIENSSPLSSSLNSEGDVSVSGQTYALGLKDSSGQNAEVQEFGNITVIASGGPAKGVLSVGSIYADVNLNGAIKVTSDTNNAYGVIVDGFGGTTGQINGNVTVQGFSYAIGVLAESGAGAVNLNITGGVNASARYNAVGIKSISYAEGSSVMVTGPTTVTSVAGSAIGIENSSPLSSTLTSDGDVTVNGATYALGLKDSSGQNSYLNEIGNITVTASNGVARGVISVGSIDANANLSGAINVTSLTGAAYGVTLSGYGGVNGQISGSVNVQAHNYALGVLAESGDGNVSLTGGADVSATSLYTNATAVRAISPFTVGVALGNVSATGLYGATGVHAEGASVNVSLQSVNANATFGNATGIYANAQMTTVSVAGNVTAKSVHYNAYGIQAYSYDGGPVSVTVGGTTVATSHYGRAIGVTAIAVGEYPGTVTVTTGDVHASGYTGAIGVIGKSLGVYTAPYYYEGPGFVSNARPNTKAIQSLYGYYQGNAVSITTGNVTASTVNGQAIGVEAIGYTTTTHVAGAVTATSVTGGAYGVLALSFNTGNVTVDGDVNAATLGYTSAYGVYAHGYGYQSVTVHGNVVALAGREATGVFVNAGTYYSENGAAKVHVDGNVYSSGGLLTYGINTRTTGNSNIYVGGDITARGAANTYFSHANGVYANSAADVTVHVGGNVTAYVPYGEAIGVNLHTYGNATANITGAVNATSVAGGNAYGVYVNAGNVATISVGSVKALGHGNAYGLQVYADQQSTIDVTGNVVAISQTGYAAGVFTKANYANVTVGGDIYVRAFHGAAMGAYVDSAYGNGTVSLTVGGNVTAIGYGNATGISAYGNKRATVYVGGNVYAGAYDGSAMGVFTDPKYTAIVHVGGNVVAKSQYGYATGIETFSKYANVTVGGDVYARAFDSDAAGVLVTAKYAGHVSVYGNVTAIATGNATGVSVDAGVRGTAFVGGNVYVYGGNTAIGVSVTGKYSNAGVRGNVTSHATEGYAVGVQVYGERVSDAYVDGNVRVSSQYGNAVGVSVVSPDGPTFVYVGGNVHVTGESLAKGVYASSPKYNSVVVEGQVTAYASQGNAFGVQTVGEANITLGGVSAVAHNDGGFAYGVDAIAPDGGSITLTVTGDVYARDYGGKAIGVLASTGGAYDFYGNIGGNVTAIADGNATGVQIESDANINLTIGGNLTAVSYAGNATGAYLYAFDTGAITVHGNVTVQALDNAVGIDIKNAGVAYAGVLGTVSVTSETGSATGVELYSLAQNTTALGGLVVMSPGNARGIWEPYGETDGATVNGDVTVVSTAGTATGIFEEASDDAYVGVTGNMLVQGAGDSVGVHATAGYFDVKIGGALTVTSAAGTAYGVVASGGGSDNYVTIGGSTYVRGLDRAVGVQAFSIGDLTIDTGAVTAISDTEAAYGIDATGCATVRVTTGDVYAKGVESSYGVHAFGGRAFVYVNGNATAVSTEGNATAVYAHAIYYAAARVYGSVLAHGEYTATGVDVSGQGGLVDVTGGVEAISDATTATGVKGYASLYDMSITVGGNVAGFGHDNATGVSGIAKDGHLTIDVGGNVYATSYTGYAVGIHAYSAELDKITVGGSVRAYGVEGATGVDLSGDGPVKANITGVVAATATAGEAIGLYAHTGSYVALYLGGASAHGVTDAFGVYVNVPGAAYLTVTGDVAAVSTGANAAGVSIRTPSVVTVDIGGNVVARAPGTADGVYVASASDVSVSAGGVYARSYNETAYGIEIKTTGNATATVTGAATAIAYGHAIAVYGNATGNVNLTVDGATTAISGELDGVAVGIKASSSGGNASARGGTNTYAYGLSQAAGVQAYGETGAYAGATGNVLAVSQGNATGVFAESPTGNVTVDVGGNSVAHGRYQAYGVSAYTFGNGTVSVTAGAAAAITTGEDGATAVGVQAGSHYGAVSVDVSGNVYAKGDDTVIGVRATAYDDANVTAGNVTALGYSDGATGIQARSLDGATRVAVTGNVYAAAKYGTAYGVLASSPNFTRVEVDGGTTVRTVEGAAYGIKATGYAVRSYLGDVTAVSQDSYATGIRVSGDLYGETDVHGNITVQAQDTAFGADITGSYTHAQVYGNVSVRSLTGNATGLYLNSSGENAVVFVGGNVFTVGKDSAYGVSVTSPAYTLIQVTGNVGAYSHYGPAIGVREIADYGKVIVGGNVTAMSDDGAAQGIAVSSPYDVVKVTVGGSVFVSGATNVQGVSVVEGYSGEVYVDGNVTALAGSGVAVGVQVNNNSSTELFSDHELVMVDGTVTAISTGGGATGISVADTATDNGGTVDVRAGNVFVKGALNAYGVNAETNEATDVNIYGNATVISTTGSAYGVLENTVGDGSVEVGGNIIATGYSNATGVSVIASGDGSVGIMGSVGAYAHNGAAFGVKEVSDGSIYIGGNATAVSDLGSATAAYLKSTGVASATVEQNVYAKGAVNATGVFVQSTDHQTVYVGGNVTALAGTGTAIGVYALQTEHSIKYANSQLVQVGGDVTAISTSGSATGILVRDYYSSTGSADVVVSGNVTAKAALNAYGVNSDVRVKYADTHVYGNVTAISTTGSAYGVLMRTKYSGSVEIGGSVGAYGAINAYGVRVSEKYSASIDVTGNATAEAGQGNATAVGAYANGGEDGVGNATIHVGGDIYAYAPGTAIGALAHGYGNAAITVGGSVFARSTHGAAMGAYASDAGDASVSITGNAKAVAYYEATAVQVDAGDGSGTANVTGNVVAESSHGDAIGVEAVATYYANVTVGGNVFAQAPGAAYGVQVSAGIGNVSVGGNVIAISAGGGATGVSVRAENGSRIYVSGYVYAAGNAVVHGIDSFTSFGDTTISVTGNVTAKSTNGDATGVYAVSGYLGNGGISYDGGDISVTVGGKTVATSFAGSAYGIYVRTAYEATVHTGDVMVYSHNGNATGISVKGDSYIGVTGNAIATSILGNARAVYGNSTGYLDVHVTGTVYAYSATENATGVVALSAGDSTIALDGYVGAHTESVGNATAVYVNSGGNNTVTIGGNVHARSGAGVVYGVLDYGNVVNITVTGEVVATTTTSNATGLLAEGSTVYASIGGAYVYSATNRAIGEEVVGAYVHANTTGDVFVKSITGAATGLYADGSERAYIGAVGNVTAVSATEEAIGARASAADYAYVSVSGKVVAESVTGEALGAYATSGNFAKIVVGGAYAYSATEKAVGIDAIGDGRAEANSTGDVRGRSYDATGIGAYAFSGDGNASVSIGGNAVGVSHFGSAYGVDITASGAASVIVTGAAMGYSNDGAAFGVDATGGNTVYVHLGSAYANGNTVAVGVAAEGGSDATVIVDGDVFAKASAGKAYGVDAASDGAATVNVGGNVVAKATAGYNAYGVYVNAQNANVTVGGSVEAIAETGSAYGVHAVTTGGASVSVGGGYVYSQNVARGVQVQAGGDVYGGVSQGTLFVKSVNDTAYGLYVTTTEGNVTLGGASGNVVAVSTDGVGVGIALISGDGSTGGSVGGYVTAIGATGATALSATASDSAGIGAGGDVDARTVNGQALGAIASAGDLSTNTASVTIGGNVQVISDYGSATGVQVLGGYGNIAVAGGVEVLGGTAAYGARSATKYGAHITIGGNTIVLATDNAAGVIALNQAGSIYVATGNILAVSTDEAAGGIVVNGGSGNVTTHTVGSITVAGQYGEGVYAKATGNVSIFVSGNVTAYGNRVAKYSGYAAVGVVSKNAANASIVVGGTVTARATGTVFGVDVYSDQSGNTSVSLGGVLATSGAAYAAVGVNANTAGNVSVGVTGNTIVMGGDYAAGVRATSYDGGNVSVSLGNLVVGESGNATTDKAFGVYTETTGNISVDITGSTLVGGELATGVYSYSTGGGNITINVGDVTVHQYAGYLGDNSAGILAYTDGNVNLTAGNIAVTGNYIEGVRLSGHNFTPTGNITLTVGNVSTTGEYSPGVYLVTTGANANITVGSTYTAGNHSDGVYLKALDGNGTVTVGNATTKGNFSDGVYVWAYGNASVTVTGTAYTKGAHSDAIYAYSQTGGTTVTANMVETKGDYSQGIHAVAGGAVVVNNGVNVTFGAHSDAVYAKNSGTTLSDTVTVTSGTAVTHGDYSDGIYAHGYHATSVTSTTVNTFGNHSIGIYAGSVNGPVTVTSGAVYTAGNYSTGIDVESGGAASVGANATVTKGYNAYGIVASASGGGSAYVNSHYVRTYGVFSGGVLAEAVNGSADVVSYDVHTSGAGSAGIYAGSQTGNASVTSTQVITDGDDAVGIDARSVGGNVSVTSTYVRTNGNFSQGIFAESSTGDVDITSHSVVTYGNYSAGIVGRNVTGDTAITATYVITHGAQSVGVYGYSEHGNVSVAQTYVATHGYQSDGVDAETMSGNASVHIGLAKTYGDNSYGGFSYSKTGNAYVGATAVITHGNLSTGLAAYAEYGNASIGSTYVRTYGDHAAALYAKGGASAQVTANTVRTSGDYSIGVLAVSAGNASSTSYYVHTSGLRSDGVYVDGDASANVNNTGYVATTGNYSVGIVARSDSGTVDVTSKTVITFGYQADGIDAYGLGDVSVTNTNVVKTTGYGAHGIDATAGNGNVSVTSKTVATYGDKATGIFAFSDHGDASVTSTMVYTAGYGSGGIDAESKYGDVNVTSNQVVTKGDHSTGIYTYAIYAGTSTIHSTDVTTFGNHSAGIWGVGYSGLKIYSDQVVTHGNYSTGIEAVNYIGDVLVSTTGVTATYGADSDAIYAQNFKSGNVSVLVGDTVYAKDGVGVHIDAEGGSAYVYNASRIFGGRGGIVASSATGTTIENYGRIAGGDGYAMGISGGGSLVNNHGSIYGYANFSAGNDTVNNAGRWFAYGDSSFGAGTDTFNNTNAVFVAPFSASAVTVNWTGLEVFNNSGLVDLRNGHTGDIFNLTSDTGGTAWNGTGSSTLGVDVAFSANLTSDKLVVGAVSGVTTLAVTDVTPGQVGVINTTGTTVVQGTSGAAGDFTWSGFKKGFIDYELKFFSLGSTVDWNIVALPDNAAFEMLKAPAMAQDFWTRSGDTWSDREQEVRDSMWGSSPPTRGEGWEMWANAVGGGQNVGRNQTFNVNGGTFTENLTTDSTWGGFQMGGDNWTSKNFLWGFTAGFVDQNSSFHLDKNSFDISGWNVGGYGGFTSGSFFLNGLIKGDWYDVKANMHTVPALETFQGNTWGAKGETGFRLGGPAFYLEPRADLSWTSTHLDNANFPGQSTVFTFGDSTSARGSIGARVGGQWGSTLPYVGIYAVEEFDGKNRMTMISGSGCPSCMTVEDTHPGAYERAEFGFTTTSWNGLEGFAKGDADFGGHTTGFTGTLGVRWQW